MPNPLEVRGKSFYFTGTLHFFKLKDAMLSVYRRLGLVASTMHDANFIVLGADYDQSVFLYRRPGTIMLTELEFLKVMGIGLKGPQQYCAESFLHPG